MRSWSVKTDKSCGVENGLETVAWAGWKTSQSIVTASKCNDENLVDGQREAVAYPRGGDRDRGRVPQI